MNRMIQLKPTTPVFFIAPLLVCFGLLPSVQAVSPEPDGGYPGGSTAEGQGALLSLTTGRFNTAVGYFSVFANVTGSFNTAVGAGALDLNTADNNTATGAAALLLNTVGSENTANGVDALAFNDTGSSNTASGAGALFHNTGGSFNTATGVQALLSNAGSFNIGSYNTATGSQALFENTIGNSNTANGISSLASNISGNFNTAHGSDALYSNTTGSHNTAIGTVALAGNTTSDNNTAVGDSALLNSQGGANVALGAGAGANVTFGSFNVYLGTGVAGVANDVGHTYIANISSTVQPPGGDVEYVTIDLNTRLLGHSSSSRRYKKDIKPMRDASEALYRLKPVTFCYRKEIDPHQSAMYGLIAEEVAEVNPSLVAHNSKGQPESVHYEMVNAMLLNEFLKEHRTVQELKSNGVKQEATIARLQKQIEALSAGLLKVSAQLAAASPSDNRPEPSKFATGRIRDGGPAPQIVNNP